MRDRHIPRVCRSCGAPQARQEDACWQCGTDWAAKGERKGTPLQVIPGGWRPPEDPWPVAAEAAVAANPPSDGSRDL